jgi:serine phosphatase RsbU (regulator of sigma subunit)
MPRGIGAWWLHRKHQSDFPNEEQHRSGMVRAMKLGSWGWLFRRPKRYIHLQQAPFWQLCLFLAAVFLLFSVFGFYYDVMAGGTEPYAVVLTSAIYNGLNVALWVLAVARLPPIIFPVVMAIQAYLPISRYLRSWAEAIFHPAAVSPEQGLHFAGTAILVAVVGSYICFSAYIRITGRETFRIKNELELAHSIQKTLVPPVSKITRSFEIYGVSEPSEKVGGDLVDIVELQGGDTVAYLADIAGHGLQAGILMGMLKTAARTALADSHETDGKAVLSELMKTLNVVLPQVKEAHMYATFTALRLNEDGESFYGMAASPPLLHWSVARKSLQRIEEQQFPLGLLPVADFPAHRLSMDVGDLVLIATDGILEVTAEMQSRRAFRRVGTPGPEFGIAALEELVAEHADRPLTEVAACILQSVRDYGKQLDDQTLLLVRRRTR